MFTMVLTDHSYWF